MSDPTPEPLYFHRNYETLTQRHAELAPEIELMFRSLGAFRYVAFFKTVFPNSNTFPNELGGSVCMARASRQLDSAFVLAAHGFHAEVRNMIRSAYESAGLGRFLAKNSDYSIATKWVQKGDWWPDSKVRKWLSDSGVVEEERVGDYRSFYALASAYAHPTRQSCFDQLRVVDGGLELVRTPDFDLANTRRSFTEVTFAALFACFAFQNGVSNASIIHPDWRREVQAIAQKLTGDDFAHLERDWEEEEGLYQAFAARIQSMDDLEEKLDNDPRSTRNIFRKSTASNGSGEIPPGD